MTVAFKVLAESVFSRSLKQVPVFLSVINPALCGLKGVLIFEDGITGLGSREAVCFDT